MALKVGDLVLAVTAHPWYLRAGVGVVYHIALGGMVFARFTNERPNDAEVPWYPDSLVLACRACHRAKNAHLPNGRCLFGASTWS